MAVSPYDGLDDRAYWRTAVASRAPGRLRALYEPRFSISREMAVFTAGSCFAHHVHRALKSAGYNVIEGEPAPEGISANVAARFFYGTFSARYGNIYNPRQFLQLLQEAAGQFSPGHPIWHRDGRFYDAFRPNVDPGGYASAEAVKMARADHLRAVTDGIKRAEVLVFTLGLTETWQDRASGAVYPSAPGVIADAPSAADIGFLSFGHDEIAADVRAIFAHVRELNANVKLLLTVAPGPLVATAGGGHVLIASSAGKAVLRAAVDTLMRSDSGIDYFPSYEIITNPAAKGAFYAANLRDPTPKGVTVVMRQFMAAYAGGTAGPHSRAVKTPASRLGAMEDDNLVICEELMHDPGLRGGAA